MAALMQLLSELNALFIREPAWAVAAHFVFCACFGSYFNLFAWRWPQIQERSWLTDMKEWFADKGWPEPQHGPLPGPERLSLSAPGSFCPSCGEPIKPWHNVPVFGWLALRGKAACCGKPISVKYPLFEALCGALGSFAWLHYGSLGGAWTFLAFALPLCMAAQTDFESMMLPDSINGYLLFLGLGLAIFGLGPLSPQQSFIGMAAAYATLAAIRWGGSLAFGREAMGQGDPKLFAAIGAWIGWIQLPQALLVAAVAGLVYAIGSRVLGSKGGAGGAVPFGPFLALGGMVCFVYHPMLG